MLGRSESLISNTESSWDDDSGPQPPRVVSLVSLKDEEPGFHVGEMVEACWEGEWFPGSVLEVHVKASEVTYDVLWEGGESCTEGLASDAIRKNKEDESGSPGPSAPPPPSPSPKRATEITIMTPSPSDSANSPDMQRTYTVAVGAEGDTDFEATVMMGKEGSPSPSSSPSPIHANHADVADSLHWKNKIATLYTENNQNPCDLAMLMKKFDGNYKELYTDLKEGFDAECGLHHAYQTRAEASVKRSRANSGAWESPRANSIYRGHGSLTPTRRYSMTLKSPKEAVELSAAAAVLTKEIEEDTEKTTIFASMEDYKPRKRRGSVAPDAGDFVSASEVDRVWGIVRSDSTASHLFNRKMSRAGTEPVRRGEAAEYWRALFDRICDGQGRPSPNLPNNADFLHEFRRLCKKYNLDPEQIRSHSEQVRRPVQAGLWGEAVREFYTVHNPNQLGKVDSLLEKNKGHEEELFKDIELAYSFLYSKQVIPKEKPIPLGDEESFASQTPSNTGLTSIDEMVSEVYSSDPENSETDELQHTQPKLDGGMLSMSLMGPAPSELWKSRLLALYSYWSVEEAGVHELLVREKGREEALWKAEVENHGMPDLGSFRFRIIAMYARHIPEQLGTVKACLVLNKGKEQAYLDTLVETHGKEPSFAFATRRCSFISLPPVPPCSDKVHAAVSLVTLSAAVFKVISRRYVRTPPLSHSKRPSPVQIPLSGSSKQMPPSVRHVLNSPPVSLLSPRKPPLSPRTPPSPTFKSQHNAAVPFSMLAPSPPPVQLPVQVPVQPVPIVVSPSTPPVLPIAVTLSSAAATPPLPVSPPAVSLPVPFPVSPPAPPAVSPPALTTAPLSPVPDVAIVPPVMKALRKAVPVVRMDGLEEEEDEHRVAIVREEAGERGRLKKLKIGEENVIDVERRWGECFDVLIKSEESKRDMTEREEAVLNMGRLQWFASFIREQDPTGREITLVQTRQETDRLEQHFSPARRELEYHTASKESNKRVQVTIETAMKALPKRREASPVSTVSVRRKRVASSSAGSNQEIGAFQRKPQQAIHVLVPKPRLADKGGVPQGCFSRPAPYLLKNPLLANAMKKGRKSI